MPRVGIKFCGGCNPAIDRAMVFQEVRDRANGLIFTGLDAQDLGAFLFICGCSTACPVEQLGFHSNPRLIVVAGEAVDGQQIPEVSIAYFVVEKLGALIRL